MFYNYIIINDLVFMGAILHNMINYYTSKLLKTKKYYYKYKIQILNTRYIAYWLSASILFSRYLYGFIAIYK